MPNLNPHDLIFFRSSEFKGFEKLLEDSYQFNIKSISYPPFVSFTARKALLQTDKGDFFLKEKPIYSSDKISLSRSSLFQSYASTKLSFVPKIRFTESKDFFVNWKNRLYFLTDYKKGRTYNGSDEDTLSMLKALRELQNIGGEFSKKVDLPAEVVEDVQSYEITNLVYLIRKQLFTKKEFELYTKIVKSFDLLKEEYINQPEKRFLMSHGDFIVFNLILNNQGVIAINDFDNAKKLPYLHDLAEFLVSSTILNYSAPLTNMKYPLLLTPDLNKLKFILKNCVEIFDIPKKGFKLLGVISEIVWLWTLCLAVLKEDYKILDLEEAIDRVENRELAGFIFELTK